MENLYPQRNILSIDLKSFFASCECVERNINPFTTPLVVANKNQGMGAITLAITPALKNHGVKSRTRLYEIPKDIAYIIVPPRMSLYIEYSQRVIDVYLDYVAKEDLHVYSIDECFLDVTNYLKLYKKTDYELAQEILEEITKRTGLTANAGIGPNILLAKIAMDTEAKLYKNGIAKWTYEDVKTKLWKIRPLSKMWGIGSKMEKRLNNLGIYSVGDLAKYNKYKLKDLYGINGEYLHQRANGIDLTIIKDLQEYKPKENSYSNSQVLFKDYDASNIQIIISEMVDIVTRRLRASNKVSSCIGLSIGYSREVGGGFYHSIKLDIATDNPKVILDYCLLIFDRFYKNLPIRKVGVVCGKISDKEFTQLNLFENLQTITKNNNELKVIDDINNKYGKNSLLKCSSLLNDSTIKMQNKKIGGHSA